MKSFLDWLNERGIRTALGIYPPAYGAGQYPPEYFMPVSATAGLAFQTTHKDLLKNVAGAKKKKKKAKAKKKK